MKSAFECFLKAAKCEMLAHASADVRPKALLATAKQWRMLGEQVRLQRMVIHVLQKAASRCSRRELGRAQRSDRRSCRFAHPATFPRGLLLGMTQVALGQAVGLTLPANPEV